MPPPDQNLVIKAFRYLARPRPRQEAGLDLVEGDPVSNEIVQKVRKHLKKPGRTPQPLPESHRLVSGA